MKRLITLQAALTFMALAATAYMLIDSSSHPLAAKGKEVSVKATLRTPTGEVGTVKLTQKGDEVTVNVKAHGLPPGFHGFHIHETGTCTGPAFTSAGFHFDHAGTGAGGTAHPSEAGDMPVLLINADGTGEAKFKTDRFVVTDLLDADGSAIIVHAGPDNFSNIPAARYQLITGTPAPSAPAGSAADQTTLNTGDAGARIACGVIEAS